MELTRTNEVLKTINQLTTQFISDSNDAMINLTQSVLCDSFDIHTNFLNSNLLQILDSFDSNYNKFLAVYNRKV